jgi:hypothetical protein
MYTVQATSRAGAKGLSLTVLQPEEEKKSPTLKRVGIKFSPFLKAL